MGFVGIKQEEVAFTQKAMCFHEPNPSHCIFKKYVTINPALPGGPNHDTDRAVDSPHVGHFAPLVNYDWRYHQSRCISKGENG